MTIAGQTFGLGPEGYDRGGHAGRRSRGCRTTRRRRSRQLGITVQLPKPTYKADGDKASGTIEGLIVTIDLKTLKPVLSPAAAGHDPRPRSRSRPRRRTSRAC